MAGFDGVTTLLPNAAIPAASVSDAAYSGAWDNVTAAAPSQNALFDYLSTNFGAGTYTPTVTAVANVSSTTAQLCLYMRLLNMVLVVGSVNITITTGAVLTQVGISLPPAYPSNLGATDLIGVNTILLANSPGGSLGADTTNKRANHFSRPATTGAVGNQFAFMYRIVP